MVEIKEMTMDELIDYINNLDLDVESQVLIQVELPKEADNESV